MPLIADAFCISFFFALDPSFSATTKPQTRFNLSIGFLWLCFCFCVVECFWRKAGDLANFCGKSVFLTCNSNLYLIFLNTWEPMHKACCPHSLHRIQNISFGKHFFTSSLPPPLLAFPFCQCPDVLPLPDISVLLSVLNERIPFTSHRPPFTHVHFSFLLSNLLI